MSHEVSISQPTREPLRVLCHPHPYVVYATKTVHALQERSPNRPPPTCLYTQLSELCAERDHLQQQLSEQQEAQQAAAFETAQVTEELQAQAAAAACLQQKLAAAEAAEAEQRARASDAEQRLSVATAELSAAKAASTVAAAAGDGTAAAEAAARQWQHEAGDARAAAAAAAARVAELESELESAWRDAAAESQAAAAMRQQQEQQLAAADAAAAAARGELEEVRQQLAAAEAELDRVKAQLVKLKEQMMNDMADEEAQLEWRVEAEVSLGVFTARCWPAVICQLHFPATLFFLGGGGLHGGAYGRQFGDRAFKRVLAPYVVIVLLQIKAVKEDAARREAALQAALDEARALAATAGGGRWVPVVKGKGGC